MSQSIQAWVAQGTTRYLTDPQFHARAQVACSITVATAKMEGVTLTEDQLACVVQAVVYGLLVAELPLGEIGQETHDSMKQAAELLGMQIVPNPVPDFPSGD